MGLTKPIIFLSISVGLLGTFWVLGGKELLNAVWNTIQRNGKPEKTTVKKANEKTPDLITDWTKSPYPGARFYTDEEIAYKTDATPMLVIVGHIFDVTKGFQMYEPGSGYHGFIGRDGTRAFVTGQFDEDGLVSDLEGLTSVQYAGIAEWLEFYLKTYKFLGYHYGRFFDNNKKPTKYFLQFIEMQEVDKHEKALRESVYKEFPSCNVEWSDKDGTNVWCSDKSGGIQRTWTGYPVLFKENAKKSARCACVRESQLDDPRISLYKGCDHLSHRCNGVS